MPEQAMCREASRKVSRIGGQIMPPDSPVLLIEDDDGDAFLVQELLSEFGASFDVMRAASLQDALQGLATCRSCSLTWICRTHRASRGLRMIKQMRPDLAVVVLTGLDDQMLGVAAFAAGAETSFRSGWERETRVSEHAPADRGCDPGLARR
jgi:CheY-like chemotaxis protein